MARVQIKLDHRGMREMLQSAEVAKAINDVADRVHEHVKAHPAVARHEMETKVVRYTTDRAAAAVDIDDAGGMAVQAKYGVLTKAARAEKLQVKARKS